MPTEYTMKQNILHIENQRKQSKNQTEEFEL
jgi:hypothetical protein